MPTPRRALVLVDVQQEYFEGPMQVQYPPRQDSLARILTAIDSAVEADIPVAVIQHSAGEDSPVYNPSKPGFALHPEIARRQKDTWKHLVKTNSSVFLNTDLVDWLTSRGVDTVTLVGYMTNNCVLASSADSERVGINIEVLSDATGAINLANAGGSADAETVHTTLLALLASNWASIATTAEWVEAVANSNVLDKSNLYESAVNGALATAN